jgi:hypothetical protein
MLVLPRLALKTYWASKKARMKPMVVRETPMREAEEAEVAEVPEEAEVIEVTEVASEEATREKTEAEEAEAPNFNTTRVHSPLYEQGPLKMISQSRE